VSGFLLSLDFYHAYERVSLPWLDIVLKAMGFDVVLCQSVATLHRQASACFMPHSLLPDLLIDFSTQQRGPAVFFTIYIELLLACLGCHLRGLLVGGYLRVFFWLYG
jgi:hypothetical protein